MYLDGEYIHHHCKPNLQAVLAGLDLLATMSRLVYPYSGENLVRIPVRIYSPTIREKPKHVKLSRKILNCDSIQSPTRTRHQIRSVSSKTCDNRSAKQTCNAMATVPINQSREVKFLGQQATMGLMCNPRKMIPFEAHRFKLLNS